VALPKGSHSANNYCPHRCGPNQHFLGHDGFTLCPIDRGHSQYWVNGWPTMAEMEKDQSELIPGDESEIEEPTSTTSDAVDEGRTSVVEDAELDAQDGADIEATDQEQDSVLDEEPESNVVEESVTEKTEGEMDEIIEGKEVVEEAQADLEAIIEEEPLDEAKDEPEVVAEAEEPVEAKASGEASADDEPEVVAEVEEPAEIEASDDASAEDEPEVVAEAEEPVEAKASGEASLDVSVDAPVADEPEVAAEAEVPAEVEASADDEPEVVAEAEEPAEAKASDDASVEASLDASADDDSVEQDQVAEDDRHWYVVHCYSGYENKVRHNLEQRIETMGMKSEIFDVVVPTEEEIEIKDGKKRTVERRVFPGYILVQPTPLRPEEVASIVKRMEAEAPRIKVTYKLGQKVRIIDGPFNDFIGTVDDIDMERAKVRVMVSFFGRETPVELDFLQVEKA